MVGESDTVSPSFSSARTGLFWIGGFFLIFVTIAVIASVFDQLNKTSTTRSPDLTGPRRTSPRAAEQPSMGLTPETATPAAP